MKKATPSPHSLLRTLRGFLLASACSPLILTAFTAYGQNPTLKFSDDFSNGLNAWVPVSGDWSVQNGVLQGTWDIGCGSNSCTQGGILLRDDLQPTTDDWRLEVDFTYSPSTCCNFDAAIGGFLLYENDNSKVHYEAGWDGYGWDGSPPNVLWFSFDTWYPWTHVDNGTIPFSWDPRAWNTLALQKQGAMYTMFLNGTAVHTFSANPLGGKPKVGLSVYGIHLYDNFKVFEVNPLSVTSYGVAPQSLWPPNNKMVPVAVNVVATGASSINIVEVSGDDGATPVDWQITGPLSANLRATRKGSGTGRTYTLTVRVADNSGHEIFVPVKVFVPHNM